MEYGSAVCYDEDCSLSSCIPRFCLCDSGTLRDVFGGVATTTTTTLTSLWC